MPNRFFLTIVLALFLIMANTLACFSAITINGITTTPSLCANNGTATVLAVSNKSNPILLYQIIAGPSTTVIQSSPTFSSLFPGTYTVRVFDIDFESTTAQFTISGNYQLPQPNPVAITPTCLGGTDGKIVGNPSPLAGRAPFNWQIIAPYTSAVQASDTFKNLSAGTYTIRMQDACGNFQTRAVFIKNEGTGFDNMQYPYAVKIGCDSFSVTTSFNLYKQKGKLPLKLILTTSSGTVIKRIRPTPVDTIAVPAIFTITDTVAGLTYGDYLKVCLEDTCGRRLCGPYTTIAPFDFEVLYSTGGGCNNSVSATMALKGPPTYPYIYTGFKTTAKMTLTDVATNTVVDMVTCISQCPFRTQEHISGRTYKIKIIDGCGQVFEKTVVWPYPALPTVNTYIGQGCIDSTAYVTFSVPNGNTVEILSGPTLVKSTKPKYAFTDNITYPKVFNMNSANNFSIKNLAAGSYQYRISDNCGNVIPGTFTVAPYHLANFKYSYRFKRGCQGNNYFYYEIPNTNAIAVYITALNTNTLVYQKSPNAFGKDSIGSLPTGKYLFQVYYGYNPSIGGQTFNGRLTTGHPDCWMVADTITIPNYTNNIFKASSSIFCNGNSYVQIQVDSSAGIPPFQYEIISGPQTYPLQSSNVFNLTNYGNYTIRVQDACGNSNSRYISIDSVRFPPIVQIGSSCIGSKITLSAISSSFFSYEWTTPRGTIIKSDSIVLNPLTAADTGLYVVKKKVTINGCTETFTTSHRVSSHDVTRQTVNLCHHYTVSVGNHTYTLPGLYTDTLRNRRGCDSIVYTTVVTQFKRKNIDSTICQGKHVTVGGHTYTQTGIYRDTLVADNGCDSLITLNLTVIPYKRYSFTKTICQGLSFYFAGQARSTAGIYYDTLSTTGCDSIVTLRLVLETPPMINIGNDTSLCIGQSYRLDPGPGFAAYYWNNNVTDSTQQVLTVNTVGTYWIKIKTFAGCTAADTVQILAIHSLPVVTAGTTQYICSGTSTTLSANSPTGLSYQWTPGNFNSASIVVKPEATITYFVTVSDIHQCVSAPASVMVWVNPSPTTPPFKEPKLKYCFDNGPFLLPAQGEKYFLWSNGDTSRSIEIKTEGLYSVTVSDDSGCFIKGEIHVKEYCPPELYFPSAFSPNGDGLHDDLEIFGKHFRNFEIKIFNRWGEIIFSSNDRQIRWDGMYRGEEMPIGTYPCIVRYQGEYEEDTEQLVLKGSVTLIR